MFDERVAKSRNVFVADAVVVLLVCTEKNERLFDVHKSENKTEEAFSPRIGRSETIRYAKAKRGRQTVNARNF